MKLHVISEWRDYLPELRWDWYDNNLGALSFSIGNRHSDPLLQVALEIRIPAWADKVMP